MRFAYDSTQPHQLAAINAVLDLFQDHPTLSPRMVAVDIPGEAAVHAVPNHLALSDSHLLENLQRVQARSANPLAPGGADLSLLPAMMTRQYTDATGGMLAGKTAEFPNFSVEMETGTGKTYVYLRTIRELYRRFGFMKFIIVVPSVAIREGVLHAMRSLDSHLSGLCGVPCEGVRYDSGRMNRVANFSRSPAAQAMVVTIDSIKGGDVLFRRSSEGLMGETPLHMIQACRPILILDEPQNMETEESQKALARLHPIFALRYSATHRKSYAMVHRLSPMEAYRSGLVKRLEISGVEGGEENAAPFRLVSLNLEGPVPSAKVEAYDRGRRKRVTMRKIDCLGQKSGLPLYNDYDLSAIHNNPPRAVFSRPGQEHIVLAEGESHGETDKEELFRAQIAATIEAHITRQRDLQALGVKVLSLFFIDKVANYRPENAEDKPLIRRIFEEEFNRMKAGRKGWKDISAEAAHAGYFAKTVSGDKERDAQAYQLIMRDKESLLTFANPKTDDAETLAKRRVAFIFTHSALREGWDNPNIFQICTLNETQSDTRKRQEIGRGVRLAVDQSGNRILDNSVNILTVIPNRNYEAYVSEYQGEVEEDYAAMVRERFGKDVKNLTPEEREWAKSYKQECSPPPPKAQRRKARAHKRHIWADKRGTTKFSAEFERLWERIQQQTDYIVDIDSDALVKRTGRILAGMKIPGMEIIRSSAVIEVNAAGDFEAHPAGSKATSVKYRGPLPDAVVVINGFLASGSAPMRLSRPTLCRIIEGDLKRAADNPYGWSRCAANAIRQALTETMEDGIVYEKTKGEVYEWRKAYKREFPFVSSHIAKLRDAKNAAYSVFPCDSKLEMDFARDLAKRKDVKLFLKLPRWFAVPTPMGNYYPDWAILFVDRKGGEKLVLVAETKGRVDSDGNVMVSNITPDELAKIHCAAAHFGSKRSGKKGALKGTDFLPLKNASQLPF